MEGLSPRLTSEGMIPLSPQLRRIGLCCSPANNLSTPQISQNPSIILTFPVHKPKNMGENSAPMANITKLCSSRCFNTPQNVLQPFPMKFTSYQPVSLTPTSDNRSTVLDVGPHSCMSAMYRRFASLSSQRLRTANTDHWTISQQHAKESS